MQVLCSLIIHSKHTTHTDINENEFLRCNIANFTKNKIISYNHHIQKGRSSHSNTNMLFQNCLTHLFKPIFTLVEKGICYTMPSYVFALFMLTVSYLFTGFAFSSCAIFHIPKLCQHTKITVKC